MASFGSGGDRNGWAKVTEENFDATFNVNGPAQHCSRCKKAAAADPLRRARSF